MRYAIFFLPAPDSEFAEIGARWLGRDIENGTRYAAPVVDGLSADEHEGLVSGPRRYGFHATLKAPFRLPPDLSREALLTAFRSFARSSNPVRIPVLSLVRLRRFFTLAPAVTNDELLMLGSDAEHHFERFRAAQTPQESSRRRSSDLTARQLRHLERYGYPFVLDEFAFHLTVTRQIRDNEAERVRDVLESVFQPVIGRGLQVDRVALVMETAPGDEFSVLAVAPLGDPLAYMRRVVHAEAMYGEVGYTRQSLAPHNPDPV